ncbi:MAG TPA: aromatic ring-hydroxylating dioxygenase subunit alpha [Gaiellales bacterium]|nr:aromatic ring-hydroxylating dioxygenase subunit alpha [Gaiellales bacterium]
MSTAEMDVRDRVATGYTLPAHWYTDPAVWRLERDRVFRRSWQYAGPAAWAVEPGDVFTCQAGHVPLVVVRDEAGTLRAHVNVCRHRGHLVASGRANRRSLQCPYHAWTYGLDGALRSVPRGEREPELDPSCLGLLPARAEVWGPFVFVNPDPAAEPLAAALGDLPGRIAAGGLDLDSVVYDHRREWTVEANWKVAIENDLECYHCPVAHPGFSNLIDVDPDRYMLEVSDTFLSQYGPLREQPRDGETPFNAVGELPRTQSHLFWPNISINVNPGRPNVGMHLWLPDGHARIAGLSDYYFAPDASSEFVEKMLAFDREVGNEDTDLVRNVQRGLESGMVSEGRVLLESEQLVHRFQMMVAAALAAED